MDNCCCCWAVLLRVVNDVGRIEDLSSSALLFEDAPDCHGHGIVRFVMRADTKAVIGVEMAQIVGCGGVGDLQGLGKDKGLRVNSKLQLQVLPQPEGLFFSPRRSAL